MLDYAFEYFEKTVFPMLKSGSIDKIIQLGDLFDRRKYVNFSTLNAVRRRFLEPLADFRIPTEIIAGNHDTYWKNTSEVNSLEEIIGKRYECIRYHVLPSNVDVGFANRSLLLPWINSNNAKVSNEAIAKLTRPDNTYVFSHLEINGFESVPGVQFTGGVDRSNFNDLIVVSGHFHIRQHQNNILYVGTPYDLNFSDRLVTKGIHVLDSEKKILKFIPNERKMFYQVLYDDTKNDVLLDSRTFKPISRKELSGKIVRLVVENKTNPNKFEYIVNDVSSCTKNLTILENTKIPELTSNVNNDITKNTLDIIYDSVDSMELAVDKMKLKKLLGEIYVECQNENILA
jgi:DNA repair exonuclease SbcCD nuclease subunit